MTTNTLMPGTREANSIVEDGAMPVEAAQKLSGLGRSTLYKLMDAGRLSYVKIGKRRLIPRRAIVQLLEAGLVVRNDPVPA